MKNILRISLVFALVLLLSLSLFACGKTPSEDSDPDKSGNEQTTGDGMTTEEGTTGGGSSNNGGGSQNGGGGEEESTTAEVTNGGLENKGNLGSENFGPFVPKK